MAYLAKKQGAHKNNRPIIGRFLNASCGDYTSGSTQEWCKFFGFAYFARMHDHNANSEKNLCGDEVYLWSRPIFANQTIYQHSRATGKKLLSEYSLLLASFDINIRLHVPSRVYIKVNTQKPRRKKLP